MGRFRAGGQPVDTLDSLSVRSGEYVYLLTINRSTTDAVTAQLLLHGATPSGPAVTTLLDGPSSLSYNTAALPQTVHLTRGALPLTGGNQLSALLFAPDGSLADLQGTSVTIRQT